MLLACVSSFAQSPAAPPVIVAPSTQANDNIALAVPGNGSAQQSVVIFPAVAGEVAEVGLRPGQSVRTGQVLVRLMDGTKRLAADLASARVDAAKTLAARCEGTATRTRALQRGNSAALSAVDQARTLCTNGLTGFLDVIEAQRSALDTRRHLLRTQADAARQAIAGFEAMGLIAPVEPV